MSTPGLKPAASIAFTQKSSAASAEGRFGAKPPSSPTLVLWPAFFSALFSAWNVSAPQRTASAIDGAPTGMIMNSWKSIGLSAWAPPLTTFIIGVGRTRARRAADIAIKRQAGGLGRGLGDRERYAEDGVGAEPRLVRRAVERDHRLVDLELIFGVEARDGVENVAIDRLDRLEDALAAIAALVAVAQFDSLARSGRSARGDGGPPHGPVLQDHIHLDRRIAAAVEDLTRDDVDDCSHDGLPCLGFPRRAFTLSRRPAKDGRIASSERLRLRTFASAAKQLTKSPRCQKIFAWQAR